MKAKSVSAAFVGAALAVSTASSLAQAKKPNILVIFGDDIGQTNVSVYSFSVMGYKTPNIDRIAREGMMFTDYYALWISVRDGSTTSMSAIASRATPLTSAQA